MSEEVEKIIDRLDKIDNQEYSCAFEFADSSTFDEVCRCFKERKIFQEEIERLNNIINELEKWLKDYIKLFDKPDMLEEQTLEDLKEVLDKLQELKGSDK